MIPTEQAYERYLIKVEKNGTNDNISTDKGRFVELFNESQNKFEELHLQNRGIDDVRYIQKFLVLDSKLSDSSQTFDHFDFNLPKNYLDLADARANASKDKCSDFLSLFEIRTENLNQILEDENNKPSFKWRESCFTINNDKISVYTDRKFKVNYILLNYYRYPNQISLVNPFDPESEFTPEIQIEWDEKSLDRILSICAGEFDINENNPRFQLQNLRQQK